MKGQVYQLVRDGFIRGRWWSQVALSFRASQASYQCLSGDRDTRVDSCVDCVLLKYVFFYGWGGGRGRCLSVAIFLKPENSSSVVLVDFYGFSPIHPKAGFVCVCVCVGVIV